jgi:hypothetical protein
MNSHRGEVIIAVSFICTAQGFSKFHLGTSEFQGLPSSTLILLGRELHIEQSQNIAYDKFFSLSAEDGYNTVSTEPSKC